MLGTATIIIVIRASPAFGKKTSAVAVFALSAITYSLFYLLKPADVGGMVAMTIINAVVYAPTIPLIWAMYADVADYSEWRTGRRATGIVFATIGFALKTGLSLGGAMAGWLLSGYGYRANATQTVDALLGIRLTVSVFPALLLVVVVICLVRYKIGKQLEGQISTELEQRRRGYAEAALPTSPGAK